MTNVRQKKKVGRFVQNLVLTRTNTSSSEQSVPQNYIVQELNQANERQNYNLKELTEAVNKLEDLIDTLDENASTNSAVHEKAKNTRITELRRLSEVVRKLDAIWAGMAAKKRKLNKLVKSMDTKFKDIVTNMETIEMKPPGSSKQNTNKPVMKKRSQFKACQKKYEKLAG